MSFQIDDDVTDLAETKDINALYSEADTFYQEADDELDIFLMGYILGQRVPEGGSVYLIDTGDFIICDDLMLYFIGSKDEVLARLRKLPDSAKLDAIKAARANQD